VSVFDEAPFTLPIVLRSLLSHSFRYGIYPLTAFSAKQPPPTPRPRAISPETAESVKSASPEPLDIESRRVVNMICSVKPIENCNELLVSRPTPLFSPIIAVTHNTPLFQMTILLRMDDKMNRQLTCQISLDDTAIALSHELVHLGFINEVSLHARAIFWLISLSLPP
jgi:nuclear receptor-binding protein